LKILEDLKLVLAGSAFTLFPCSDDFREMQRSCFYPFSFFRRVSGNARLLLLPFFSFQTSLGQCTPFAFTLFLYLDEFGAMHAFCFSPFSFFRRVSGNARLLLLPFFFFQTSLGQCTPFAFTLFPCSDHFRVMQGHCYCRISFFRGFSGYANFTHKV
jgi:hypothetical protein